MDVKVLRGFLVLLKNKKKLANLRGNKQYERFGRSLLVYVKALVAKQGVRFLSEQEDITTYIIVKILSALESNTKLVEVFLADPRRFFSWVRKIVNNSVVDYYRSWWRRKVIQLSALIHKKNAMFESDIDGAELEARFMSESDFSDNVIRELKAQEILDKLTEPERRLLILRLKFAYPYKAISKILRVSEAVLRKRFERIKKKIALGYLKGDTGVQRQNEK